MKDLTPSFAARVAPEKLKSSQPAAFNFEDNLKGELSMNVIPNTNGLYGLSRQLQLFRLKNMQGSNKTRPMKIQKDTAGYWYYNLTMNWKMYKLYEHRMLMSVYRPVEGWEKLQINHKDGNKANNNLDNLEWVTAMQNLHHAKMTGLTPRNTARLTIEQVHDVRRLLKSTNLSKRKIGRMFNVRHSSICHISDGKSYKWLPYEN